MASNSRDGPKPPAEPAASRGSSSHAKRKQKRPANWWRPTRTPMILSVNAQGGGRRGDPTDLAGEEPIFRSFKFGSYGGWCLFARLTNLSSSV